MYNNGVYLAKNPTWHIEDSHWKATQILKMMQRNNLRPRTVCEVGCGAGEILRQLQINMATDCFFSGYEISNQAFELSKNKANDRLQFKLMDFLAEKDVFFDIILLIDLIEHLEDYYTFLRQLRSKSVYKIIHVPLDMSAQMVARRVPIMAVRNSVGHIHYFMKDIVISFLKDTGYEILDYFYTAESLDLPPRSLEMKIARIPRKILFAINKDIAVRTLGGFSLMVLVK
ncbi:MAG: class I SAM-dependent methyltransferase [Candidatus Methanospirareceae archaeon]